MDKTYYSITEVARMAGVSRQYVHKQWTQGAFKHSHQDSFSKRVKLHRRDVIKWLGGRGINLLEVEK